MDITSIISPAIILIDLLYVVKNPITCLLAAPEIIASMSRGNAMPNPKKIKLSKFIIKLETDVLNANKTTKAAGLQGSTIAPKNNPNISALK